MKRRQFIGSCAVAGGFVGVSGCGGGAGAVSAQPLPNPTAPSTPASAPSPTTALNVKFTIEGAVAGQLMPFTIGHAFQRGQVPPDTTVLADIDAFQCAVKNRWPDGSVKFAVLSGAVALGTSLRSTVMLSVGASVSPAPVAIALADLRATGLVASIGFGDFGRAEWSGAAWDTPFINWVAGPRMSSWVYRQQLGSDPHLVGWLEVRCYRGGQVEVLAWLENGYLKVPLPTSKSGMATFTLGASQRFAQTLTLQNHQRAVLANGEQITHWLADKLVSWPKHDVAHLMSTRLVPNYAGHTPANSNLFTRLPTAYVPLAQASMPTEMGSAGYDPSIGLLPEWDAAYLTTGADRRAYTAVLINGCAAGRYGSHFRDETTQRPIRLSSYPNLALGGGTGVTSAGTSSRGLYTPTAAGTAPPRYASSHHPSMGYMAYLLTGWHYFAEECQFVAALNYLKQSDTSRQAAKGVFESGAGANTTRGAAWALRTLSQAACICPDEDPLHDEWTASLDANINTYHSRYVSTPNNPLGLVQPYDNYNNGVGPWMGAVWMDDFFTATLGHMKDLGVVGSVSTSRLEELLTWKCRSVVGRLGGSGAQEFSYTQGAQYTVAYSPTAVADWSGPGPWYASWGEVARAMALPTQGEDGSSLVSGYPTEPTSYWGNLMPALAAAVDHRASGAAAAWARLQSAPNFSQLQSGFDHHPVWGVKPR